MNRLLTKVRAKELKKSYRDKNGLAYGRYRLSVEIEGPAVKELSVPTKVIGKKIVLQRDFMLPWGVKKGDLLVLDTRETARALSRRPDDVDGVFARCGETICKKADVDRDGRTEDVLANCFVRAAFQAHRGARLLSLVDTLGRDRMAVPFNYARAGKYVMLGGAEEVLQEAGSPGDLWKSEFEREDPVAADDGVRITYCHKFKSPKGVTLKKEIALEPDLPGVIHRYTLTYAGRGKEEDADEKPGTDGRDAKTKPDRTDISFGVAMTPSVSSVLDSATMFVLPTTGSVTQVRYHRPAFGRRWRWRDWRHEHFGLRAGYVLSFDELTGAALAVLFKPHKAYASMRCDFAAPELSIHHATRRLGKGRRTAFGIVMLVGDAHAADENSLLLLTRGRGRRGETELAVTLRTRHRTDAMKAGIEAGDGKRRTILLKKLELPEAGSVFVGRVAVKTSSLPVRCSVKVGDERLACELETRRGAP